jgi:hypothetical protein
MAVDNPFYVPLLVLLGFGAFVGLLVIVLGFWCQFRKQNQTHRERMKAMEQGQLPEVLRAQAEVTRARVAVTVGVLVPLLLMAAAVGGTALILTWGELTSRLAILCVIWGVCGLVSLVAAARSLGVLRQRGRRDGAETAPPRESEPGAPDAAAPVKEGTRLPRE